MNWQRVTSSVGRLLSNQTGLYVEFKIEGKPYYGCRTTLRREDVNTSAGLAEDYQFSLLVPASQFDGANLPKPRQSKVICDGAEYRLLAIETDAIKATFKLHLGEVLA